MVLHVVFCKGVPEKNLVQQKRNFFPISLSNFKLTNTITYLRLTSNFIIQNMSTGQIILSDKV